MIYLDNAATTKPSEKALASFLEVNRTSFANSSSPHAYGREADRLLNKAREKILSLLKINNSHRLIFTSGATEANNLALKGIALQYKRRGNKIISTEGEHSSVRKVLEELHLDHGFEIIYLPLDKEGKINPDDLIKAMDEQVILVSIISTNNETGAKNDIERIGRILKDYPKAFFHVDVTQSMGKEKLSFENVDAISFSGHKFGGVKGIGGLAIKSNIILKGVNNGGNQEYGYRPGTVDVASCYSMAIALEESLSFDDEEAIKMNSFLRENLDKDEFIIVSPKDASPYILNVILKKKKASVIVEALSREGIYVSSHSACDDRINIPSSILLSMGYKEDEARNAIRISLSHDNNLEEIKTFVERINQICKEVKDR